MRRYDWFMTDEKHDDRDERVAISLDPEEALRALLKVDPDAEPAEVDPPKRRSTKHAG
jgi:hypothetical protein